MRIHIYVGFYVQPRVQLINFKFSFLIAVISNVKNNRLNNGKIFDIFFCLFVTAPKSSNGSEPLNLRMDSGHSMYRFPFYNSFKNFHQHQSG